MEATGRIREFFRNIFCKPLTVIPIILYFILFVAIVGLALSGVSIYGVIFFGVVMAVIIYCQTSVCRNESITAFPFPPYRFGNYPSETIAIQTETDNDYGKKNKPRYHPCSTETNSPKGRSPSPKPDAGTCSITMANDDDVSSDENESKASSTNDFELSQASCHVSPLPSRLDQDIQPQMQENAHNDIKYDWKALEIEDSDQDVIEECEERFEVRGV